MKIKFKNVSSDLDFSKIFPVIDKDDYALVAGRELVIEDSVGESIKSKGFLNLGEITISLSLIDFINVQGISIEQEEVLSKINETTINQEDLVDIIFKGVELRKNVLLYGKGGHNKSEGTIAVLNQMKDKGIIDSEPFVMTFGDGLTEEALFGGMDMKKFSEHGIIEYLVNNSFLDHEIVVIEELFDGPPQVLLALKDVLTSGYLRKGNQKYKSKVKTIIALTNKSKEAFAEDDSLEALAQRFAYTLKVEWNSYLKSDFISLFRKVLGEEKYKANSKKLSTLADIIAQNNASGSSFVSPRTAINAVNLYLVNGNLSYISDICPKVLDKFNKELKELEIDAADEEVFAKSREYLIKNDISAITVDSGVIDIINMIEEKRTGQPSIIYVNKENYASKLFKAKFLLNSFKSHSFGAKNKNKAIEFIEEITSTITQLSK